ncbi:unnamed protein product [Cunninghamella echinulata]
MLWSNEIYFKYNLAPTEKHYIFNSGFIHLSYASLGTENIKPGKTQLKVISQGTEYILCTLTKDTREQKLNLCFNEENDGDCILTVSGVNTISLLGNVIEDDEDYEYEEEDEDEDDRGTLQFRDPSDNRFLGGFELRHFGIEDEDSQLSAFLPNDNIDLRKEEQSEDDKLLHDNIVQGLINAMLNSGDAYQKQRAKKIQSKLIYKQSN